jgi:hypothetical protein
MTCISLRDHGPLQVVPSRELFLALSCVCLQGRSSDAPEGPPEDPSASNAGDRMRERRMMGQDSVDLTPEEYASALKAFTEGKAVADAFDASAAEDQWRVAIKAKVMGEGGGGGAHNGRSALATAAAFGTFARRVGSSLSAAAISVRNNWCVLVWCVTWCLSVAGGGVGLCDRCCGLSERGVDRSPYRGNGRHAAGASPHCMMCVSVPPSIPSFYCRIAFCRHSWQAACLVPRLCPCPCPRRRPRHGPGGSHGP